MKKLPIVILLLIATNFFQGECLAQTSKKSRFKALVLSENGGHHLPFTEAAKPWLSKLAIDSSFTIDYIENTKTINEALLKQYQVFIQLDLPSLYLERRIYESFSKIYEQRKSWMGWITSCNVIR